ncbi:alcohol dehydrogenase-like protein [Xylaria nigripes]|nr:alcohol dehydrogenase-like protein [Xylaria nigripes]
MSSTEAIPNVPKTHRACLYDKPGTCSISIQDVPTPEPGPGEVLVKLTHSGICHSDFGIMMNNWKVLPHKTPAGQIGGHEGVGHIVRLGAGSEKTGVKIGDRVGIKWLASACLTCPPCMDGQEGCCFNQTISGYYRPGTFQEYVIGSAQYVTPVPEHIPGEIAAPMLCGGLTTYAALKKSGAQPGQWVVISGAGGGLGSIATSLGAHSMGFRIIGIDMPNKKETVLESGAEHFIDLTAFDDKSIGDEVKRLTGIGAVAVIVCTASNKAYGQALSMLRFGGSLVCVGMPEGELVPISNAYPSALVAQQLKIVASSVGNRREAVETLDMAARGVAKVPVRTYAMQDLQSVFERMSKGQVIGRAVLDFSV